MYIESPHVNGISRNYGKTFSQRVSGINLITLMWTDGDTHIPCDYRLYNKQQDHLTKNDHFQALITTAHERGFRPECVVFDSWYSSLKNLKTIGNHQWHWLTQLKSNRQVNLNRQGNQPVGQLPISQKGSVVHLKGYGLIRVFKIVSKNGNSEYWASSDLSMNELYRLKYAECQWFREIIASIRFLRIERHCFSTGISWFEAKASIIRKAVRAYLAKPIYTLNPTA